MALFINPFVYGTTATTLFLDTYTDAVAAYSVRKLRTAYTGSALRVRRDSDNTEQDIGFDGSGNLDESALGAFVGTDSGYVTKWYDQTANARDAAQTTGTAQPRIVNAGTIDKVNGKVAVTFPSSRTMSVTNSVGYFRNVGIGEAFFVTKSNSTASGARYLYAHTTPTNTTQRFSVYDSGTTADRFTMVARRLDAQATATTATFGTNHGTTAQYLLSVYADWTNGTISIKQNGAGQVTASLPSSGNTSDTDAAAITIGGSRTTSTYNGWQQEIILFNTDQTSNRTAIESNINTYFAIY